MKQQQQWMLTLAVSAVALWPAVSLAGTSGLQERIERLENQVQSMNAGGLSLSSAGAVDLSVLDEERKGIRNRVSGTHLMVNKNNKLMFGAYGRVNRAFQVADNGNNTYYRHVDNDHFTTGLGFYGVGDVSSEFKVFADVQFDIQSNATANISQATSNNTAGFNERRLQLIFAHDRYGTLSAGHGSMASDGTAEQSLLDAPDISNMDPADLAGGYSFSRNGWNAFNLSQNLANTSTITGAFNNFDGLGRNDRIRYDSPEYYGFKVAGSHHDNHTRDISLWHHYENDVLKWKAAIAYAESNVGGVESEIVDGSASLLHKPTGLGISYSRGEQEVDTANTPDADIWTLQLGYQTVFCPNWGNTAFVADYSNSDNQSSNAAAVRSADGKAYGFGVEQHIDAYNTHVYAVVRKYEYDDANGTYDDIVAGMLGARVTF